MRSLILKLTWFGLCLVLTFYFLNNHYRLLAQQSSVVSGSVKVSICGNEIVEGGEECDNDDLDGQTCETLGYQSGTLVCDIACDFDTSGCIPYPTPTPTPTPTMTPTPTITPVLTSTPTPAITEETVQTVDEEVVEVETLLVTTPQPIITPTPTPAPFSILPPPLKFFDLDGDGKISLSEKVQSITIWVEYWRQSFRIGDGQSTCDLNNDGRCDLIDFSILLYYINRE